MQKTDKFERLWLEYIQTIPPLDVINDGKYRDKLKEFTWKVYAEGITEGRAIEVETSGDMKKDLIGRLGELIDEVGKWE